MNLNMNHAINDRTTWAINLYAVPSGELLSLTEELTKNWHIRAKSLPQTGLGMLKLNDSAFNEPFYLGEFPLSTAWLEVTTSDGQIAEGAAQIMDDRVELSEALAICDAILSSVLPGYDRVLMLVEKGTGIRQQRHKDRQHILAATQVNFSLLDHVGNDDEA